MGGGTIIYVLESTIIYEYCGWITNHFGDEDDRVDGDGVELRGVEAQEPEEAVEERGGLLQVRVLLVVALSERSAEQGSHPLGRIQTHEPPGRLPVRYHVCSTRVLVYKLEEELFYAGRRSKLYPLLVIIVLIIILTFKTASQETNSFLK